jgi:Fe-S-cluster-containing hydrogenase component 2
MKAIRVSPKKCKGCRLCEAMCSFSHTGTIAPTRSRIRIRSEPLKGKDVPVVCQQCKEEPCAAACPFGAIVRNSKQGILIINEDDCRACGSCIEACPFGAVFLDSESGKAIKCDLCGGDPICVKMCPVPFHDTKAAIRYIEKG